MPDRDNAEDIPAVSVEEILSVANSIQMGKAPGIDGVPNQVLKTVMIANAEIFVDLFTTCLREGIFPKCWKLQRRRRSGLSELQFGFRKGRSTIDAVEEVCTIAQAALEGTRWRGGAKEYCVVITLDIKNAFNSADFGAVIRALQTMAVPGYLISVIKSYFSDRALMYETDEGVKRYSVTAGVPQGSVLGPVLWNVMYDGILRVEKPSSVTIVGYADDIAVVAVAKRIVELRNKSERVIQNIQCWLQQNGLVLAEHKTEMVLLSSRKKVESMSIRVGDHYVTSSSAIRYLGIMIDHRLSFKTHLISAGQKALRVGTAIAQLLPNTGGPRQAARRLLASVSTSVMMYGAPVWYSATGFDSYMRTMRSAHRLASLRVCCAFRTVSEAAASVIAGRLPPELQAKRDSAVRNLRMLQLADRSHLSMVNVNIVEQWQQKWDESTKGRWTHSLIPHIGTWLNKKHGETNFYLTQFLTGHGCFREYLFKYKHVEHPYCLSCASSIESVEHVFIECPRFNAARRAIQIIVNEPPSCVAMVRHMVESYEKWQKISHIITAVMQQLRRDEQNSH